MVTILLGLFMGFPDPGVTFANRVPPELWSAPLHSPLEYHPLPRVHSDPGWHYQYGRGRIDGRCSAVDGAILRCNWDRAHV